MNDDGTKSDVTPFDISRIKVSLQDNDEPDVMSSKINEKFPIVRLKRLSTAEISKWTTTATNKKNNFDALVTKSASQNGRITRSKAAQSIVKADIDQTGVATMLSDENIQPNNQFEKAQKRRSDINSQNYRAASKKKKLNDESSIEVSTNPVPIDEIPINEEKPTTSDQTIARIPFTVGEVVWEKIRGSPHWPAKIQKIENRRFVVEWFNDYRTTRLYRSQIYKFCPNFNVFSDKFDTTIGFKDAAEEALLYGMKHRL